MARRELKTLGQHPQDKPDRARSGHAGMPAGHGETQAIMAYKQPEMGRHYLERVTGIEPALSAWEVHRSVPSSAVTCDGTCPWVAASDPYGPVLIAR